MDIISNSYVGWADNIEKNKIKMSLFTMSVVRLIISKSTHHPINKKPHG